MTKQSDDAQRAGPQTSEAKFSDLKKEIAGRNEQAHNAARELRAKREREQFGIVARHRVNLDQ